MDNWFTIDEIDADVYIISEYRHWEWGFSSGLTFNFSSAIRYLLF